MKKQQFLCIIMLCYSGNIRFLFNSSSFFSFNFTIDRDVFLFVQVQYIYPFIDSTSSIILCITIRCLYYYIHINILKLTCLLLYYIYTMININVQYYAVQNMNEIRIRESIKSTGDHLIPFSLSLYFDQVKLKGKVSERNII